MRNIVSPLSGIRSPFGGRSDLYKTAGFRPEFVADFGGEYYRANLARSTFADTLTFSRASSATMVDSTGTLVTVGVDEPRIGHHIWDGSAWVNAGYLHESEARTNLVTYSATLSTQNVTVTAVPHTLHFTGTGTITLSGASTAGPLVGTGTGENNRVSLTFTPTAGTLTLTVSGTVTNADLEVGSTLSSHKPTTGATATRAAETLTAPSANLPWPTPQVIGDELVTNGTFDTDTGWTKEAGWTIGSGVAACDGSSNNLYQNAGLVSGTCYVVTFTISTYTSGSVRFNSGSVNGVSRSAAGTYTEVIVATNSVNVVFDATSFNGTIDNISVKEINPLAVSIQMEGTETFADEGTADQVLLYDRRVDANNRITLSLDTDSTKVGTLTLTMVNGGSSATISTTAELTPGVNDPFNVAIVCTSNEIGIALDGTAETRVSHSIGLPDLSAEDATLGGNGTRALVRAWSQDITDAGQESATS